MRKAFNVVKAAAADDSDPITLHGRSYISAPETRESIMCGETGAKGQIIDTSNLWLAGGVRTCEWQFQRLPQILQCCRFGGEVIVHHSCSFRNDRHVFTDSVFVSRPNF